MKGLRKFGKNALGGLLLLAGVVLLIGGGVNGISLRWLEHPEATERLLWLEHTWRMLGITAATVGGLVVAVFGWFVLDD